MNNELQIFNNVGYAAPNKAIAMHVDKDDKLNDKTALSLANASKALDIRNVSDCKARLNEKGIVITDTLTNGVNRLKEDGVYTMDIIVIENESYQANQNLFTSTTS